MRRLGVLALVLVATIAFVALHGHAARSTTIRHSCGLTDRQFLTNYQLQLETIGMDGDSYLQGDLSGDELIAASREAARVVRSWAPTDPTLLLARRLAPAMFGEYAEAVQAREEHRSAARHMYLAYSIGARVEDVLREAQPELEAAGCSVGDLV